MNNKEKREYISDLVTYDSPPFVSEFPTRGSFLNNTPNKLFKYRPFDSHSFEMIENEYAFLAPVEGLDDPFDCLNSSDINFFYDVERGTFKRQGLDYILRLIPEKSLPQGVTKLEIKKLARKAMQGEALDYDCIVDDPLIRARSSTKEIDFFLQTVKSLKEVFPRKLDERAWVEFAKNALFPGGNVGVCSLSEAKDNKPMWSLYGGGYKGYCVEFGIPRNRDLVLNLCPVIYTKHANNGLIRKLLEHTLGVTMRAVSGGIIRGNIGAAMELFCTKDTDWSYQKEWRIIGKAAEHCTLLPINSIYLGFRAAKRNIAKMKRLAKTKGFSLFLMNPPDGTKRITYSQLV